MAAEIAEQVALAETGAVGDVAQERVVPAALTEQGCGELDQLAAAGESSQRLAQSPVVPTRRRTVVVRSPVADDAIAAGSATATVARGDDEDAVVTLAARVLR